jgi:hypothetical protein
MFNAGFHHEHHDIPGVAWNHLPRIREIASEFYEGLVYHDSYLRLIWLFIFSRSFNLYCRIIRETEIQSEQGISELEIKRALQRTLESIQDEDREESRASRLRVPGVLVP